MSLRSYVGEPYESAFNSLLATGFIASNIGTSYEPSDTVPSGAIISQTPESGEVVPGQTYISFRVSQGPDTKTLDDISGYTKSDAQSYLAGIGAEYIGHETYEYSPTVEKDKVIRTVPGVGAKVAKGTIVNVVYSKGPDPASSSSKEESSDSSSSSSRQPQVQVVQVHQRKIVQAVVKLAIVRAICKERGTKSKKHFCLILLKRINGGSRSNSFGRSRNSQKFEKQFS